MGKNCINLIYWADHPNFGDYLSPYIVGKLTGRNICHKKASISWLNLIKFVIGHVLEIKNLSQYVMPWETNYIGVGSVLSYGNSRSMIWGGGFMDSREKFYGGKVYALRGKLSAKKIGLHNNEVVYGDPALLLPLLYVPKTLNKFSVGIVPHWKEFKHFNQKYHNKYKVIDLSTKDVEQVIDEICSCQMILSTSLHGIIVAHAYGIPAIWIKNGDINTDGFKFWDYFSSVGINDYCGFKNYDDIIKSPSSILDFFDSHVDISLPRISIRTIQNKLLSSTPFVILEKWEKEYQ